MAKKKVTIDDLAKITKVGFNDVDKKFEMVDKRLTRIESIMVTKDYLDDKLADLKGDVIAVIKGDRERDRVFKTRLLMIIRRNKLAKASELKLLSELIR